MDILFCKSEIEVYRITPQVGKHYETAEYTRKVGKWPNEKYFTTNTPTYVGKFVKTEQFGLGDGAQIFSVFNNNGNLETVAYTYEGTTCFRALEP
jgi:hypothetical protein